VVGGVVDDGVVDDGVVDDGVVDDGVVDAFASGVAAAQQTPETIAATAAATTRNLSPLFNMFPSSLRTRVASSSRRALCVPVAELGC
jgi:hypothetical protein